MCFHRSHARLRVSGVMGRGGMCLTRNNGRSGRFGVAGQSSSSSGALFESSSLGRLHDTVSVLMLHSASAERLGNVGSGIGLFLLLLPFMIAAMQLLMPVGRYAAGRCGVCPRHVCGVFELRTDEVAVRARARLRSDGHLRPRLHTLNYLGGLTHIL